MTAATSLPEACAIAFKEWAGICAALAEGEQSLILRKGGIAEGPRGFVPEHRVFWLYPTQVHQAEQGLRRAWPSEVLEPSSPATVSLRALAAVETIGFVDREEILPALADLHVWTEETVRKRFHYRTPGLWVLGVRVFRKSVPHAIAVRPDQAGCRTWVELASPLETSAAVPALDDEAFVRRMEQLRSALGRDR